MNTSVVYLTHSLGFFPIFVLLAVVFVCCVAFVVVIIFHRKKVILCKTLLALRSNISDLKEKRIFAQVPEPFPKISLMPFFMA